MAQTVDVEFGDMEDGFTPGRAGTGGSDLPDLPAEFSEVPFERGTVGMARSQDPDSANSQFFIMFDEGSFLNGQYTVVKSEEHTSELQSLMRISYAVFCLKKKKINRIDSI